MFRSSDDVLGLVRNVVDLTGFVCGAMLKTKELIYVSFALDDGVSLNARIFCPFCGEFMLAEWAIFNRIGPNLNVKNDDWIVVLDEKQ